MKKSGKETFMKIIHSWIGQGVRQVGIIASFILLIRFSPRLALAKCGATTWTGGCCGMSREGSWRTSTRTRGCGSTPSGRTLSSPRSCRYRAAPPGPCCGGRVTDVCDSQSHWPRTMSHCIATASAQASAEPFGSVYNGVFA